MTGADAVVSTLYKNGVRVIFGYPGGSVLPVYDRLRSSRIKHYMPTHEQHACHAADGYARASGRTGVVLATSGPGATNLVTGIANAYMDSVPLVAITGNVPLPLLGHDAFQETDIAGVTMPITKHNFIVKNADELAPTLSAAFRIAGSGRKGPVLVDIPSDLLYAPVRDGGGEPLPKKHIALSDAELQEAAELIDGAKHPFICVGGGERAGGAYRRFGCGHGNGQGRISVIRRALRRACRYAYRTGDGGGAPSLRSVYCLRGTVFRKADEKHSDLCAQGADTAF